MTRLALVLAAGAALAAAPAAAQSARPDAAVRASAPVGALAYRLPMTAPLEALPTEALSAEALPVPDPRADSLRPPPDEWLGRDKALHFGASFLLTLSSQYLLTDKAGASDGGAAPAAAAIALGFGVAKEVADSRRRVHPLFSLRDLAADALGVALGVLVTQL